MGRSISDRMSNSNHYMCSGEATSYFYRVISVYRVVCILCKYKLCIYYIWKKFCVILFLCNHFINGILKIKIC